MRFAATIACLLLMLASTQAATTATQPETAEHMRASRDDRGGTILFFDDMESGTNGWTTLDESIGSGNHFHWDTYMAFEGQSWWCGCFNYDADGGYGNSWDDRLVVPTVDVSGATYPILTYAFRHDSEVNYDYTYVQAESMGSYVNVNQGYDGVQAWTDIGVYGFVLVPYDNPLNDNSESCHKRYR